MTQNKVVSLGWAVAKYMDSPAHPDTLIIISPADTKGDTLIPTESVRIAGTGSLRKLRDFLNEILEESCSS